MPVYEIQCTKTRACRSWERRFRSLEDFQEQYHAGRVKCPVCGSCRVDRLNSLTAPPRFNGSGFYQTDYPKK